MINRSIKIRNLGGKVDISVTFSLRKIVLSLLVLLCSCSLFAQTTVAGNKLGKELEKNTDKNAIFVSEIDLRKMQVTDSGTVTIPLLSKSKVKIVAGMDMTGIGSRLSHSKLKKWKTTFEVKDLNAKVYSVTSIEGIETVAQYRERYLEEKKAEARKNLTKMPVQVVIQESINLGGAENAWLPGQIQDKLKSNLQDYLGLKTVVDSKSETALKRLQAESESEARDESTAIELGKITTAKFAVFTKIRRTGTGYTISVDFTDLTTGEQMASSTSKEYSKAEYLYGSTGAVDELTLAIGNKLGIKISDFNKNLLTSGSAGFSIEDQLALAKQNEAQFKKMMSDYDAELSKLITSNDINAIQNKNRIEAEKALLVEKQNAEKKRQEELKAQMARAAEDEKLEAERSIALKTQRDQMAKDAAAKAAEVRKLKMEKQGVLGQINVIESKKKALVEIRQSVEARQQELYAQLEKDRENEESRIRNKTYSTVELGSDGKPTEQAKQRRENQIIKSNEDLTNRFFADCDAVKKSIAKQDADLLAEIRNDQKNLSKNRITSSLGDELKVSYGKYEGSRNGWIVYFSLYSEGVLVQSWSKILDYIVVSGKQPPVMATEMNDAVIEEYTNNVDMYSSLFMRGDPILYYEIDYNVVAKDDTKPSQYDFNFYRIRIFNTVKGDTGHYWDLKNSVKTITMKPEWDLRELNQVINEKFISEANKMLDDMGCHMIAIPKRNYCILNTEVTQKLYSSIIGSNPSDHNKGDNYPVELVSWYDAIYFCNKLSMKLGMTPAYSVNGFTNPDKWGYTPHKGNSIEAVVKWNKTADGFRLPTQEEWEYAAKGGQNYTYSGSNNLSEVGWYEANSNYSTHPVAQKKSNSYGLYDMNGNVEEWCWDTDSRNSYIRYTRGGTSLMNARYCTVSSGSDYHRANIRTAYLGFRIVCSAFN